METKPSAREKAGRLDARLGRGLRSLSFKVLFGTAVILLLPALLIAGVLSVGWNQLTDIKVHHDRSIRPVQKYVERAKTNINKTQADIRRALKKARDVQEIATISMRQKEASALAIQIASIVKAAPPEQREKPTLIPEIRRLLTVKHFGSESETLIVIHKKPVYDAQHHMLRPWQHIIGMYWDAEQVGKPLSHAHKNYDKLIVDRGWEQKLLSAVKRPGFVTATLFIYKIYSRSPVAKPGTSAPTGGPAKGSNASPRASRENNDLYLMAHIPGTNWSLAARTTLTGPVQKLIDNVVTEFNKVKVSL